MNLRFFRIDDPVHREAAELLPWLVNGTLDGSERERVERHVAQCVACRRDLEAARALHAAVASEERDPAVADGLARLRARLSEEEAGLGVARLWRSLAEGWHRAPAWARGALAAQLALVLVLACALAVPLLPGRSAPSLYHTLGDAPPVTFRRHALVVVFRGERSEQEIRRLLLRADARIVDGPSSVGAYTVEVPDGRQQAALALLRTDPGVAFAEPVPGQTPVPR
ncbi:MAG TPA: zf-HC2 domain-containing protein [Burkholderiales bacterium]|nr:zf-HC2 domain-containing protein [Burkholderiales bacterium]